MRESFADRKAIGEPPLIKSGGVSGLANTRLFSPRVGDDEGANGGDENVGRERDGDPERLDVRDVREEGRVSSSMDAIGNEDEEA